MLYVILSRSSYAYSTLIAPQNDKRIIMNYFDSKSRCQAWTIVPFTSIKIIKFCESNFNGQIEISTIVLQARFLTIYELSFWYTHKHNLFIISVFVNLIRSVATCMASISNPRWILRNSWVIKYLIQSAIFCYCIFISKLFSVEKRPKKYYNKCQSAWGRLLFFN